MIKTYKINQEKVEVPWSVGFGQKSVTDRHSLISNEPFINCLLCGKKKSGKTSFGLFCCVKYFMTRGTKLVIFSPDIANDKDNVQCILYLKKKYGNENVVIYKSFFQENKTNAFLAELGEASEAFQVEDESAHAYPRTIFLFDDLSEKDLKSDEISHFCNNIRHYGALCIYSSQDWMNFAPSLRKSADISILWRDIDEERLRKIHSEMQPRENFKDFVRAYNYATSDSPKDFLFVDKIDKQLRKNLDEELIIKQI